jgi:hypothetical protein
MKYTYLMALSVCRSQLQVWDKWGGELWSGGPGRRYLLPKLVSCIFLYFFSPFGCWVLGLIVGCVCRWCCSCGCRWLFLVVGCWLLIFFVGCCSDFFFVGAQLW